MIIMFDILIFSKDRACQLDLLLNSIKKFFLFDTNINILYTYSNKDFGKGYDILKGKNKNIVWHKQNNFELDTKKIINNFTKKYTLFLCDDDVFINFVEFDDLMELLELYTKEIHCISMRMNSTINFCYPAKLEMIIPKFIESKYYLKWNWTEYNPHTCWGYPMSIDNHIYKTNNIVNLINTLHFYNVNDLEANINRNRWRNKPFMLSFLQTKIYNIQNNFVKEKSNEEVIQLNENFIDDKKINPKNIYYLNPKSCHGYLKYEFN